MKLIVGLGNPGRDYEKNRHNVGFLVINRLAGQLNASLSSGKFDGRFGQASFKGDKLLLLEPQTFMNLSGRSAAAAATFYKVPPTELLVVHDELDLPFGRLQLKAGGGAGGHNGLRSITESLGTDSYGRLRVGVGKPDGPGAKDRVVGHVLSDFSEHEPLEALLDDAVAAVLAWSEKGMAAAMNQVNRRPAKAPAGDPT